ncbi:MAG: putative peptidoglycan glycosyltransferase FtsW [Lachnospiraceae bacterium]|nr:putative peptidoglycan glycosyltransferase FtsW [Lachnospiraceae bacterium]
MGKVLDAITGKQFRQKNGKGYFDYNLLAVVIILICFGLIMLYSASSYEGLVKHQTDVFFLKRQALIFAGSIVGALLVSWVDYHWLVKASGVIYWLAFFLMALVPFIGVEHNGAKRWISLKVLEFQPSEVAKIAVIICMSSMIVGFGKNITRKRNFFFMLGAVLLQFLGAYLLTDNLSTAIIIFGIGALLMLVYYPNSRNLWIHILVVIAVVVAVLLWLKNYYVMPQDAASFRLGRIVNWLDRKNNLDGGGYQVMQGLYAIGSGGLFGKGLGNSTQKIIRIPEAQNDMIFSIICEELGLFGAILLLVLFGYLLFRLYYIAQNARDLYGSVIATGVMFHLSLQIILNMCVVLDLIPTTGISLPFVSFGGTAIVFLMGEIGVCLSISRQIRIPEKNRGKDS